MKGLHQLVNKKDYGGKKQVQELISGQIEHVWHVQLAPDLIFPFDIDKLNQQVIKCLSHISDFKSTQVLSWKHSKNKPSGLIPQAWLMNESSFNKASCLPWCLLLPWASRFPWDDWDNIVHKWVTRILTSYRHRRGDELISQSGHPDGASGPVDTGADRGPAEGLEMHVLQM